MLIDEHSKPTKQQIEDTKEFHDLNVSNRSTDDWYCLLRKAQGDVTVYSTGRLKFMRDSNDFIKDSLFCEWGYIINLDTNKLEVWKGWQQKPDKSNRYGHSYDKDISSRGSGKFYPCKLVAKYPLDNLPTAEAFVKELEPEEIAA